mmetsp:Transcript_22321/g.63474  ORF Transcript_22321/g.63474 Transcript_22321/m.63474 type:complete len:169 (+) Transcript_22321:40-546(+)
MALTRTRLREWLAKEEAACAQRSSTGAAWARSLCEEAAAPRELRLVCLIEPGDPSSRRTVATLERAVAELPPGVKIEVVEGEPRFDILELRDACVDWLCAASFFPTTALLLDNEPLVLQRSESADSFTFSGPLALEQVVDLVRYAHQVVSDAPNDQAIEAVPCPLSVL